MSVFLIALLLFPGQKPKAPTVKPDAKKTFQAIYNRMYAAFNKRDTAGMLESFAPDFATSGRTGKPMGLEDVRKSLEGTLKTAKDVKGGAAVQNAAVTGKKATVIVKLTVFVTIVDPRNGQDIKRGQETVSNDEWDRSSGKWLLKSQTRISAKAL